MDSQITSSSIEGAKNNLNQIPEMVRALGLGMTLSGDSKMFPADLLTAAILNRTIGTYEGFKVMIDTQNMAASNSLLRTHIDTLIRYNALWLVEDPHAFSIKVMAGGRIDKMKDRVGKQMRDAYLIECLATEHKWLPSVYKNLSGSIHFSANHFSDVIHAVTDEIITLKIGAGDTYDDSTWIEVIDCFSETTRNIFTLVAGYIESKDALGG